MNEYFSKKFIDNEVVNTIRNNIKIWPIDNYSKSCATLFTSLLT